MAAKIPLTYESSVPASPGVVVPFDTFAILPEAGDNAGICRKVTPKGTRFTLPGSSEVFELSHTCLEGHRFAVAHVAPGVHLKSWNLTFAFALKPILPGQYLANARVLAALRARGVTDLPLEPNMEDLIVPHEVNEAEFKAHEQVPLMVDAGATTFQGFAREGGRGVGTRNYIILVGTTSLAAGYVKALEAAAKKAGLLGGGTLDGIVAVAHTEGTGNREEGYRPHNYDLLCTTLAAFCVHPNVGAALLVDYGSNEEAVWGEEVVAKAAQAGMPLSAVPYSHVRLTGDLQADLALGLERITHHLPTVQAAARTPQPTSFLSVAQQCGGSDAFSGVSGNPCAGEACKLLIQFGGQAVLAETDELMGAESYILSKVKDLNTANKFMTLINNFKDRLSWHGQSAESNPSGGNNWRGLYNIGLKSLGAAKKKHADVSLDGVLDYGERTVNMGRGYYFMDSPGNDLESIAGQVATGCNVIYFITGNGSITNFPFVPTIKIVTTTERFKLLEKDMDFNAGECNTFLAAGGFVMVNNCTSHSSSFNLPLNSPPPHPPTPPTHTHSTPPACFTRPLPGGHPHGAARQGVV
jgi:altronate dehydratase